YAHCGDVVPLATDALLDRSLALFCLLEPGVRVEPERQERDETAVGAQEAQLARRRAGRILDDPLDVARVDGDLATGRRLRQRLEMGLHRIDLRDGRGDRALHLLRDLVRLLEREIAGKLEVERELGAT